MRPILYEQNETLFDTNGIGILHDAESCTVTEVRNGEFELEMEYPLKGAWISELQTNRYILAKPNDYDPPHAFRIYETEVSLENNKLTVKAVTITDSLSGILVKPFASVTAVPTGAWEQIKRNAIDPVNIRFTSDITTTAAMQHDEIKNVLSLISGTEGSLVDAYGGEVLRTNDQIYFYRRRGQDHVTTIRPRKNLKNIKIVTSMTGKYTSIIPYAKYTPEGENQKEVVVYGDVVRSKHYDDYYIKRMSPVDVTSKIKDGKNRDQIKVITKDMVDKVSKKYFEQNYGIDLPNVKIDVDMVPISDTTAWEKAIIRALINTRLCDTVDVYVPKIGVNITVKVNKIEYDVLAERIKKISASTNGNDRSSLAETQRAEWKQVANKVAADALSNIAESVNTVISTLDGINQNFFGPDTPPTEGLRQNDIWYKSIGEGKVEMYRYDGTQWNLIIPANFEEEIDNKIQDYANEIKSKLDAFSVSNEEMKTKVAKVIDDANEILNRASTDQSAQIAEAKSKLAQIEKDFNANRQYLSAKLQELIEKGTEDELALSTYKRDIDHNLSELEKTIVSYGGEISTVKTLISQANDRINLATEKYDEVKGSVDANKSRLDLLPGEINLAVSNAKESSKEYTDSKIQLSEGRITTSVNNSLNGKVNGLISSSITQEAGIIRQALNSIKDEAISLANRNTQTIIENKAGEIRQTLIETVKSIPRKYGGRNFLSQTDKKFYSGAYQLNENNYFVIKSYNFVGGKTLKELGVKLTDKLIIQYSVKFDENVTNARVIPEFYKNNNYIQGFVNIPDKDNLLDLNISGKGLVTKVGIITLSEQVWSEANHIRFRVDNSQNVQFSVEKCILHSGDSIVDWSPAVEDNLYDTGGKNILRNGDFQLNISDDEKARKDLWSIVDYNNKNELTINYGEHGFNQFKQKGIIHIYGHNSSYYWFNQNIYNLNYKKGDIITISMDISREGDNRTWDTKPPFTFELVGVNSSGQTKNYTHHFQSYEDGLRDAVNGDGQLHRVGYSFEMEDNVVELRFKLTFFPDIYINLYFTNLQIEQSKFLNGFKKNPLDIDLSQNSKFQAVLNRVDLFSRTLGENENGINTKIAQMVMKSDEIQTFVSNGGSPFNNLILDTDTFNSAKSNKQYDTDGNYFDAIPGNYGSKPYTFIISYNKNRPSRWIGQSLPLSINKINAGETYTIMFKYRIYSVNHTKGFSSYGFELKDHNHQNSIVLLHLAERNNNLVFDKEIYFHKTFVADKTVEFSSSGLHPFFYWADYSGRIDIREIMLVKGSTLPDKYQPVLPGSATMVNQLSNSYAIRALNSANSIVTEVNVNVNGIRFKGKNLEFDGDTLIHNGIIKNAHISDATISSAKIANLDAKKVYGLEGIFNNLIANKGNISKIFTNGIDIGNTTTLYASSGVLNIDHRGGVTNEVTIRSNGRIATPGWFNGRATSNTNYTPVMTNVYMNSPLESKINNVNVYAVRGLFLISFPEQTNEYGGHVWLYANDGSNQNHTYYVGMKRAESQTDWNYGFR